MLQNKNAIIVCDMKECGAEFLLSSIVKEEQYIKAGAEIGLKHSFFTCPSCGHVYTIDITDTALRLKIKQFKLLYKKQRRLLENKCSEQKLRNNQTKLDTLRGEILNRGQELKRKWCSE